MPATGRSAPPGWKFHEWEMKGIPLRIEIGPRDISKEEVTLVRRDKKEKISIREDNVVEKVSVLLEEIQNNLFEKAKRLQNDLMTRVENFEEFKKTIKKKGGFVRACWCLESKCENAVKEETGADIRVMPFVDEEVFGSCVHCGKQGKKVVYFARSY